jgi:hypothetical protein
MLFTLFIMNGTIVFLLHLSHVHNVCLNFIIGISNPVSFLAAYACFCCPCLTAQLSKRVGDHTLTCLVNPAALMVIRTKVRTAYKIKVNIYEYLSIFLTRFLFLGKFNRRLLYDTMLRMPMCCHADRQRTRSPSCS